MKQKPTAIRRIARFVFVVFAVAILFILGWLYMPAPWQPIQALSDSWVFKENQDGPTIGDLGGLPVKIPKAFAWFVEYDADPGFMEKRGGLPPKRTFQSKLRSFGFEIRYPDMASVDAKAPEERLKEPNIHTTMWMRVGVLSGEAYGDGGDESLERLAKVPSDPESLKYTFTYPYQPLPELVHGLTGFTPIGADLSARDLASGKGADTKDRNIYYYRGEDGRVLSYIECSNMLHSAARCNQKFNLSPAMRAHVSVGYRKELLPHWREIQSSVTQVILGFRADPQTANPAK